MPVDKNIHPMEGAFAVSSEAETRALAARLAQSLVPGDIVLLTGGLGAGKTAFVKGLLTGLGGDAEDVTSPSFVILNVYEGASLPLYHFDLYRLEGGDALPDLDEYLFGGGVCAVEWPQFMEAAFEGLSPIRVNIDFADGAHGRAVTIGRAAL